MQTWIIGILGSIGGVLLACAVAWAGADQGVLYDGLSVFVWCGVFAFAVQWLIFIHAWFAPPSVSAKASLPLFAEFPVSAFIKIVGSESPWTFNKAFGLAVPIPSVPIFFKFLFISINCT